MDPSLLCKTFFGLGTVVDIGGTLFPSFRTHIMNYGSRSTTSKTPELKAPTGFIQGLIEIVGSLQVPHAWFTHYYVVSVLSSLFWGFQICTKGSTFKLLASYSHPRTSNMAANQVLLAWSFMAFQGVRRLYESITLTKPSQSRMWVGLWAIGMAYYAFMGISVWIEGIGERLSYGISARLTFPDVLSQDIPLTGLLEFSKPSLKTFIALPLFMLASAIQHTCHLHLASLKKYTLPHHRLFQSVVCPHYTSECMIYLSIAIVAAPKGQVLNRTVFTGLGFVFSNLAVTADSTRKWYIEKFGIEKLADRRRMVPYVY